MEDRRMRKSRRVAEKLSEYGWEIMEIGILVAFPSMRTDAQSQEPLATT